MASPRPTLVFVAALVISTFHTNSVEAQARSGVLPAAFMSDSVAWERILTYVVSSLSTHLVRTASDTSRQPWRITLPPDEPQRALLEAQLRTILRARPVVPEDTVVYELEIGPFVVANDTGRVRVRTDFATRCAGTSRLAGYGNIDRVYVVRHPTAGWSIARTEGVLHGDRVGCPSARNSISRISADNKRSIRIASHETGRVESHVVFLLGDSVLLNTDSGVRAIALANVDSVWGQQGTAAPLVGLIAGLPCALFAGMVGNFIGGDPDSQGSPGRATVLTLLGFLGGGLVCGSVGAGIGSLIRYWHLEYARPANAGN